MAWLRSQSKYQSTYVIQQTNQGLEELRACSAKTQHLCYKKHSEGCGCFVMWGILLKITGSRSNDRAVVVHRPTGGCLLLAFQPHPWDKPQTFRTSGLVPRGRRAVPYGYKFLTAFWSPSVSGWLLLLLL